MSSIDDRIVNLKFNNQGFTKGVDETVAGLKKLDSSLKMRDGTKGLQDVQNEAKKISLARLGEAVQTIGGKFNAMGVAATAALATVASKATAAGLQLASSLTLKPISDGFQEYETKMGSIQTILANTQQRYGTTLADVSKSLNELNTYADKTIYSFADMTRNIGLFTNAGLGLEESTAMIKGFSNAAAASGTDSTRAAGAAYQLSQALSVGEIRLMDWRSLTNAGMGNKNMQEGLIQIADAMGTVSRSGLQASDIQKDFNGSLEKGWLTTDVMSAYLRILAQEDENLNVQMMKNIGLSDEQIKGFLAQQKTAQEAATKVRTFTQLMSTMAEAVGSGWAQTFEILFGNFEEASELWTGVNKVADSIISSMTDSRNNVLQGWKDLGGRTDLFAGLKAVLGGIGAILVKIGEGFRQVFPPMTAERLKGITEGFRRLGESFRNSISGDTANNIRRTFAGIFAAFKSLTTIGGSLGRVFGGIVAGAGKLAQGLLYVTAELGDFMVALTKPVREGGKLNDVATALAHGISKLAGSLRDAMSGVKGIGEAISSAINSWSKSGGADGFLSRFNFGSIVKGATALGKALGELFSNINLERAAGMLQALFGAKMAAAVSGMALAFTKFGTSMHLGLASVRVLLKNSGKLFESALFKLGSGTIGGVFDGVTGSLEQMQNKLKAETLKELGKALLMLAGSIVLMTLVDPSKLAGATAAMTVLITELTAATFALTRFGGVVGSVKMAANTASIVGLASALLVVSLAIAKLGTLSWGEIARGLTGITGALTLMTGATAAMSLIGKVRVKTTQILALSGAMYIIGQSLSNAAQLSWSEIARGLVAMTAAMGVFVGTIAAMSLVSKGAVDTVRIALLTGSVTGVATMFNKLGKMSWSEISRGLVAFSGSMGILVATMALLGSRKGLADGVDRVSWSMLALAGALKIMGTMSWDEIGRGLAAAGGGLGLMAIGMQAMSGAGPGVKNLIPAAIGLTGLGVALKVMSTLSWGDIIKGLIGVGAALAVVGIAGPLLAGTTGPMLGAAAALVLLGVGLVGAGAGLTAISIGVQAVVTVLMTSILTIIAGLTSIVTSVITGTGQILQAVIGLGGIIAAQAPVIIQTLVGIGTIFLQTLIQLAPQILELISNMLAGMLSLIITNAPQIAQAFVAVVRSFLTAVQTLGPEIIHTFVVLLTSILDAVVQITPKLMQTLGVLVNAAASCLEQHIPRLVQAGINMLFGILRGIEGNIYRIVTVASNIIVNFINGISANLGRVIDSGVRLAISFVNGVANSIRNNYAAMWAAGRNLGSAIIDGMTGGLYSKAYAAYNAVAGIARNVIAWGKSVLGIHSPSREFYDIGQYSVMGMAKGLDDNRAAVKSAGSLAKSVMDEVSDLTGSSPVITPILDTSMLRHGLSRVLNGGYQTSVGLATNLQSSSSSATHSASGQNRGTFGNVVNNYFNQNNYSPKALSQAEIYRNTKTLMALI